MNNIERKIKRIEYDQAAIEYAIAPSFWRPIMSCWFIWFGCSWAIGSVLILAPLIAKAIKGLL